MIDTKNNIAWNILFDKYKIHKHVIKEGYYEITSSQINEFREARLMTKFDFKSQLPDIFSENNLAILPISRGSYMISDFKAFKNFESEDPVPIKIDFPNLFGKYKT